MHLRLVEPGPADPALDRDALLMEAVKAIADLRDVEDRHTRSMLGSCLSVAESRGGISRAKVTGPRPADSAVEESLSHRLGRAMGAIDRLVATYDPFYEDEDSLMFGVFQSAGASLKRNLNRLLQQERDTEIDREVRLYSERWRESDLPRKPGISHTARRRLVSAGVWKREQVRGMTDAELLAIKGIGPKSLEQLRAAIAGHPFGSG